MFLLWHPWLTTTMQSPIRFLFVKLPPRPCAVLLVIYIVFFVRMCILQRYIAVSNIAHDSQMRNICTKWQFQVTETGTIALKHSPTMSNGYMFGPIMIPCVQQLVADWCFVSKRLYNLWSIVGRVPGKMLEVYGKEGGWFCNPFFGKVRRCDIEIVAKKSMWTQYV